MREEISIWLKKARRDLEIAEYNLNGDMLEAAAYIATRYPDVAETYDKESVSEVEKGIEI